MQLTLTLSSKDTTKGSSVRMMRLRTSRLARGGRSSSARESHIITNQRHTWNLHKMHVVTINKSYYKVLQNTKKECFLHSLTIQNVVKNERKAYPSSFLWEVSARRTVVGWTWHGGPCRAGKAETNEDVNKQAELSFTFIPFPHQTLSLLLHLRPNKSQQKIIKHSVHIYIVVMM
jgi:hypothetical protein